MKAFVITLLENKQSVESANRCIASGKKTGLTIKKFQAVTPDDEPLEILERKGIAPDKFDEKYSRNLNCISAFLSHHTLWEMCARDNETYVIFEHDAVMFDYIPCTTFNYVMNIGKPSYGKWNSNFTNIGVNPLTSKRYFPGAHAYMVTPAGAKLLVENAPMYARPTDVYLNLDVFPWLQEWYPFVAEARDSFTTIQTVTGCLAKHNWNDGEGYEIIDA